MDILKLESYALSKVGEAAEVYLNCLFGQLPVVLAAQHCDMPLPGRTMGTQLPRTFIN